MEKKMKKLLFSALMVLSFFILSCGISDKKKGLQDIAQPVDPALCNHGEERDLACGINNRGLKHEVCFEGRWISNYQCVDPDVCKDNDVDVKTCGVLGASTDVCVEGQWDFGECEDDFIKPDGEIPVESKGNHLYFSAKKYDDKYNSDLYMIDMTSPEPTLVQLTDTPNLYEISPSLPGDNSFIVYANGYYDDPSFSRIRFVKLDDSGKPIPGTDKEILPMDRETCNGGNTTIFYGKGNPSVSLDGSEIVFVNTYRFDTDDFGCSKTAYKPARVSIDSDGNPGTIDNLGWDEGLAPGKTMSVPISPVYLWNTKLIVLSLKGIDQHPISSEIQICDEECNTFADWGYLTYQAIWSLDNVAQVSIGASVNSDEIIFFRAFPGNDFDTGIYTAGNIIETSPHPIYGPYGVYDTTEKFISGFSSIYMKSTYRALAFSPDSKLIAVVITFIDSEIKNEKHSNIVIMNRESGEVIRSFDFANDPLREVDGLNWR